METAIKLNLRLFDDVINTTGSSGTGNELSHEMKTYYDSTLIDIAGPRLVHDQFAQKRPIPKNGGKTIEFRKYTPLSKALTPLTEGVTPDGNKLDVSIVTSTVKHLGDQAGATLDTVTREVLNGGTNVQYAEGQTASRATLTQDMKLTVKAVKMAVRALKRQNTPKIDGWYVGIIHPDIAYDLMEDPEWKEWHKYTNPDNAYQNEIGEIGGVRFVESTEAKIFAKTGSAGTGSTKIDVYSTLILGANAYGVTEITGGGLETIVKQLGSGGTADPLNQRATAGWKATKTAERLVEQYVVRVETGCTFSEGKEN